jgi:lipooligosaccharide transport system ATP-binding protein
VNVVELQQVTKRFGARVAVDSLDLEVPERVCFGLLGPNGAGKTTTLRMIYGVTTPSEGSIRVFGRDVAHEARALKARLGVALQDNVLIEELTPAENLRVFARYHLLREPALGRRVEALLDFLELRSHADVAARNLSGGYQRRLAIAMSLVNDPDLLVLDEPTTGLDPAVRLARWARIRELRAAGKSILLTTHYMDEAERLCDVVAIIHGGRVAAQGAPRALIERHLAREAVELDCDAADEAKLLDGVGGIAKRLRAGRHLVLFADDATPIAAAIHARDGAKPRPLVSRPANLEDVFLLLTGTGLEGGA